MDTLIQRLEITADELEDKNLKPMAATVKEAIKALSDHSSERQVDAGVIQKLIEENKRLKDAISTVLRWAEFEMHNCSKCGNADPVKDCDYVYELKNAIAG